VLEHFENEEIKLKILAPWSDNNNHFLKIAKPRFSERKKLAF